MVLYMTQFSYGAEAVAAMAKNPQDRSVGLKRLIENLGGRLIAIYFCFGDYDGVAIGEYPDGTTALATVMAATGAGHIKAIKTTELFTMDETIQAMKKAGAQMYAAPKA